jgi:hypothetical protein
MQVFFERNGLQEKLRKWTGMPCGFISPSSKGVLVNNDDVAWAVCCRFEGGNMKTGERRFGKTYEHL